MKAHFSAICIAEWGPMPSPALAALISSTVLRACGLPLNASLDETFSTLKYINIFLIYIHV